MKTNVEIGAALDEIADLLELDDANPFRVRAYRNAAKKMRELDKPATAVKLTSLGGIGADLAGKITEIANTGTTEILDEVRGKWPPGVRDLLAVDGLGPKRVKALHESLAIKDIDDLKRAVDAGALAKVPALGASLEKKLQETLKHGVNTTRFPLAVVEPIADELLSFLWRVKGVICVDAAGSLRRRKATVGDLDMLACAQDGRAVIHAFTAHKRVTVVLGAGDTRGTVKLDNGLQVDLRVVPQESYGAALLYLTGNKNHSIQLRAAAIKLGLKLNEYGVWRGDEKLAGETEESMYEAVGMTFIPPEQREK